jgi:BioD-like phosphotransacetylase family protein
MVCELQVLGCGIGIFCVVYNPHRHLKKKKNSLVTPGKRTKVILAITAPAKAQVELTYFPS